MSIVFPEVHQSEWRWVDTDNKFDRIIENNATIDKLVEHVKTLVQ